MTPIRVATAAVCAAALISPAVGQDVVSRSDDGLVTVEAFLAALENADLDKLVETFHEDATVFLPMTEAPWRLVGRAAIRGGFEPLLRAVRRSSGGPPYMTLRPHGIEAQRLANDVSVVTLHLGPAPGEPVTRTVTVSRRTFVLRRNDGVWQIVHLHGSNMVIGPPRPGE